MRNKEIKNDIYEIEKWEEKVKQKDLKYKTIKKVFRKCFWTGWESVFTSPICFLQKHEKLEKLRVTLLREKLVLKSARVNYA